jgi:nucleotide-binding universal stress UspA family protein
MSIGCAVDFSPTSLHAARVAAALAARRDEPLLLIHAAGPEGPRQEALDRLVADLSRGGRVVQGRRIVAGAGAAHALSLMARTDGLELLVMGKSKRRDGPAADLEAIARSSPVPVLAVPSDSRLLQWLAGERPLRVLLGVDGSLPFRAAREWLSGLYEVGPVEATAGRAYWPPVEFQRLGVPQPLMFSEESPALRHYLERDVAAAVGVLPDGKHPAVRLRIGVGPIADQLCVMAEEMDADLLVVGTHHRRGLDRAWSVSLRLLRRSDRPVAVVPGPQEAGAGLPDLSAVLVAVDFSPAAAAAVQYAAAIARPGGTLHVAHVRMPQTAADPLEGLEGLERRMRELVPTAVRERGVEVLVDVLPEGEPALAISQLAERLDVDAICVGSHGRGAVASAVLGSTSRGVLARSARPVLVIRRPEA